MQGGSLCVGLSGMVGIRVRGGCASRPWQPWSFEKKNEEGVERMGKNSHNRLDRNIMLDEQARGARMWRAGRGCWLWEAHWQGRGTV